MLNNSSSISKDQFASTHSDNNMSSMVTQVKHGQMIKPA